MPFAPRYFPHYIRPESDLMAERYAATILLVIEADSQDEAYRIQRAAAKKLRSFLGGENVEVEASMLGLNYVAKSEKERGA